MVLRRHRVTALGLLANEIMATPPFPLLWSGERSSRPAAWIVLVAATAIGVLHNANQWIAHGALVRPGSIGLWKTELTLVISLSAPCRRSSAIACCAGAALVLMLLTELTLHASA